MTPEKALKKLREICLRLPEATETITYGNPTFLAGKRTFVVLDHYKGEYAIAFKATRADQAALVMDPRFYVSPYSGKHGWTSLRLEDGLNWDEVESLVESAYRLVALKRMLQAMERSSAD